VPRSLRCTQSVLRSGDNWADGELAFLGGFYTTVDGFVGGFGAFDIQDFVFLALQFVIADKKMLDLLDEFLAQVVDVLNFGPGVIADFDDDDAVVTVDVFLFFDLFAFDDADRAGFDQTADERGLVHEDQDIDGIAITGFSGRNEAEVVRKAHAGGKNAAKKEDAVVGIVGVFVAAAFGSFDNGVDDVAVVFVERTETIRVGIAGPGVIAGHESSWLYEMVLC